MFSSLEALDDAQDDALGALPVARQGAFQPKAKPRARKAGGGGSVASAPASSKKSNDSRSARQADGAVSNTPGGQLDCSVEDRNRVADSAAAVCIDVASAADAGPAPQETTVGSDEGAQRPCESTVFSQLGRETVRTPPVLPEDVVHNQIESDLERALTNVNEALVTSTIIASHDQVCQEVEENANDDVPPKLKNAGETVSPEEACQDIEGQLVTVVTRKQKKARVKVALPKESVLETCGNDCTKPALQDDTQQLQSIVSEAVKQKKRRSRKAHVQQDYSETIPLNKSSNQASTETRKPMRGRLSVFAAVASATSQPGVEIAANRSSVSGPAIVEEGQKQKRLKRSTLRKKRVERPAVNLAEPDLDPKNLTMKQIIRLAEAKERKSKEGSSSGANDSSQITPVNGEAEQRNERTSFAPQVQIVDGRIVINQESLSISAHPLNDMRQYKRVEETHSKLNYHSYVRRTPKQAWKYEDTELFYKALQEFGTNFALMQHLFPGRTRRQIFLKFKKEERACPLRVAEAMTKKSTENAQFMEVINRLNLLPNEACDIAEHQQGPEPLETSSVKEGLEHNTSVSLEKEETAGLKMDDSMSKNGEEENMNDTSNQKNNINEGVRSPTIDSPKKDLSPPQRKSSFSYQTLSSKPSKSLFSYQRI